MLHSKKNQSILQWFNSLTTKEDVNSLEQFSDGSKFYDIVTFMSKECNLVGRSGIFSDTNIACNEIISSVEIEEKTETYVNDASFVIKESDETEKKYDAIKKFIDDFYHLESSSLISYKECQNGKGLELAKVAVFLLSAKMLGLLSAKDELVYNPTLLELEMQENIRECFSYVIVDEDGDKIRKSEFQRILNRPASIPLRKQPSRSNSVPAVAAGIKIIPKKRKERTSIIYEDLQYSPLRQLLDSPTIQSQAFDLKKDLVQNKLRSDFLNEENKTTHLTLENKNLKEELEEKKKKLEFYKKDPESYKGDPESPHVTFFDKEEQERLKDEESKDKNMEEERVKDLIEAQKEEKENKEALQQKLDDLEKKFQLDQEPTASSHVASSNLKEKIQTLEPGNEGKDEAIKTKNEKIANLVKELQGNQQMNQDFFVSFSRKESSNLENDHKNDQQSIQDSSVSKSRKELNKYTSQESSKIKDQELTKDFKTNEDLIERLVPQTTGEISNNKNPDAESPMVDHLLCRIRSLEREVKKLEYYEPKFGPVPVNFFVSRDLNSLKNEFALFSASADISEINNSHSTKNDCKMDIRLLPNAFQLSGTGFFLSSPQKLAFAKMAYDKTTLISVIKQLGKKSFIPLYKSKNLRAKCNKIKNPHAFSAGLGDLLKALSCPMEPSVTTRKSSSLATKEIVANFLISKNRIKNLESELQVVKQTVKSLQAKLIKKEDEFKIANQNLETLQVSNADLKKELQKKKEECIIKGDMYDSLQDLANNKKKELRRSTTFYQILIDHRKAERAEGCEECKKLRKNAKEMDTICANLKNEIMRLKTSNNYLEQKDVCSRNDIKSLEKQIEELKEKLLNEELLNEESATSKKAADRYAFASFCFAVKTPESSKEEDPHPKMKEEEKKECVIKKKDYDEASTLNYFWDSSCSSRNSSLDSCISRNRSFQTMNENDYFSASSLSELYNDHTQEDADEEGDSEVTFPVKKCKVSETVAVSVRSSAALKRLKERKKLTMKKTVVTKPNTQPLKEASMVITDYPQSSCTRKIPVNMEQLMAMHRKN